MAREEGEEEKKRRLKRNTIEERFKEERSLDKEEDIYLWLFVMVVVK